MSGKVDMSPRAVEERLAELARLSASDTVWQPRVAMTAVAVEARLRECAEMSAVCAELASAQPMAGRAPARPR